jgi:PAS domain S-box-containing protein
VVINLDARSLLEKLASGIRDNVDVYLMNEEGDYLLHPDPARTFGFDRGRRYRWDEEMVPVNSLTEEPGVFYRIKTNDGAYYATLERIHFDAQQPQRFLTLAYTVPDSYIMQKVASTRNVLIGGVLAALLALGLLIFLYMKRISAPLLQLTKAVDSISRRQYGTALPKVSTGVIGAFVNAFRRMQADIRERETKILQLNDDLKHSETVANLIIDTAPDAIVVVDTDGLIVRANHKMDSLFGYSHQEMIGKPVEMLIPPRYRENHPLLRRQLLANKPSRVMNLERELQALHKDGSEFWVQIGLGVMELDSECFVIAALADISGRKAAEEALQETAQRLKHSNEELEQFAYVASHDLQEPLRSIAGPLQLLHKRYIGQLDDAADKLLQYSVDGATRMQQLIEDLLTLSRASRSERPFSRIDCNQLLDQVKQVLSAAIHKTGASLEWQNLPWVHGDRSQLFQLFQNLVGNAIKFHGDRKPRIEVSAVREQNGRWRFKVQDNGIGIEPQHRERVFRVFQRLHARREYSGTGIGLALCKRIVERHGGNIWVDSAADEGTALYFDLLEAQPQVDDIKEDSIGTRSQAN